MKRERRACKSLTLGEYSKSTELLLVDVLCHAPCHICHGSRTAAHRDGVSTCGIALKCARENAVKDCGDAKHVEDEIELPVRNSGAPGAPAIGRDIFRFAGNAEQG